MENPYKASEIESDVGVGVEQSQRAPRIVTLLLGMLVGGLMGTVGGAVTSGMLGLTVGAFQDSGALGTLVFIGGMIGAASGLFAGIPTGAGLALFMSGEPPPEATRIWTVTITVSTGLGIGFALLGVYLISIFEKLEGNLSEAYVQGALMGAGGACCTGLLLTRVLFRIQEFRRRKHSPNA